MIKIIECPRDAMQGLKSFIPTEDKINYINQLLRVGFHTIDFGSFVSPKAIPQMRDTAEVIQSLDLSDTDTKLLAIVANMRGATDASKFAAIDYLGFPFSISETFQIRNTNSTIRESFEKVKQMQQLCVENGKEMVVYISMGFGNPYGDEWNAKIVEKWTTELVNAGVKIIQLSDTIGVSTPESIAYLFSHLTAKFSSDEIEIGAHLHTTPRTWKEKIIAATENGCRRFDGAIRGFGGCPMARDTLTGNMPTENLVFYFDEIGLNTGINPKAFLKSMSLAGEIFPKH